MIIQAQGPRWHEKAWVEPMREKMERQSPSKRPSLDIAQDVVAVFTKVAHNAATCGESILLWDAVWRYPTALF